MVAAEAKRATGSVSKAACHIANSRTKAKIKIKATWAQSRATMARCLVPQCSSGREPPSGRNRLRAVGGAVKDDPFAQRADRTLIVAPTWVVDAKASVDG